MSLPLDVLDRTPEEAARRIALLQVDAVEAAAARLGDLSDDGALHDFRVAVRRLRSTLRAWRGALRGAVGRKHARALRRLQGATGGWRDAEVALAWLAGQAGDLPPAQRAGARRLADRLRARLGCPDHASRATVELAGERVVARLRARLAVLRVEVRLDGAPAGTRFGTAVAEAARSGLRTLRARLAAVTSSEDRAEAHRARIATKRLRYLLEPLRAHVPAARAVVAACKRLQDVLGDLNDAHVLTQEVRAELAAATEEDVARLAGHARRGDVRALRRALREGDRVGLLAIAQRLRLRRRHLFDALHAGWLADEAAGLAAHVAAFADESGRRRAAGAEIERKYLLAGAPELPEEAQVLEIEQGYLPSPAGEARLRRGHGAGGERLVWTSKLGTGLQRRELQVEVASEVFAALWPLTAGRRVRKRRHVVRDGAATWEIDEFLDRDLWLAEIELDDVDQEVAIPDWLAPVVISEVTASGAYANRKLAM